MPFVCLQYVNDRILLRQAYEELTSASRLSLSWLTKKLMKFHGTNRIPRKKILLPVVNTSSYRDFLHSRDPDDFKKESPKPKKQTANESLFMQDIRPMKTNSIGNPEESLYCSRHRIGFRLWAISGNTNIDINRCCFSYHHPTPWNEAFDNNFNCIS